VHGYKDHSGFGFLSHPGLSYQAAPATAHFDFLSLLEVQPFGVFGMDFDEDLRVLVVEGGASPAHSAREKLGEDGPGSQPEWIVAIRGLGRWAKICAMEQPFTSTEPVFVQVRGARVDGSLICSNASIAFLGGTRKVIWMSSF